MSADHSNYESGGLNLNAGHFAQLSEWDIFFLVDIRLLTRKQVALMCLAQIAYQFYLYPCVGFSMCSLDLHNLLYPYSR
jgi:hypothetical protein